MRTAFVSRLVLSRALLVVFATLGALSWSWTAVAEPLRGAILLEGASTGDAEVELAIRDYLGRHNMVVMSMETVATAREFATKVPGQPLDDNDLRQLRERLAAARLIVVETRAAAGKVAVAVAVVEEQSVRRRFVSVDPELLVREVGALLNEVAPEPPKPLAQDVVVRSDDVPRSAAGARVPQVDTSAVANVEAEGEGAAIEEPDRVSPAPRRFMFGVGGAVGTNEVGAGVGFRLVTRFKERFAVGFDSTFLYRDASFDGGSYRSSSHIVEIAQAATLGYVLDVQGAEVIPHLGIVGARSFVFGDLNHETGWAAGVVGGLVNLRPGPLYIFCSADLYFRDGAFLLLSFGVGF